MEEKIGMTAELDHLAPLTSVSLSRRVPVKPVVGQPGIEGIQFPGKKLCVVFAVLHKGSRHGIVAPLSRVFQVENLVAQPEKAEDILEIIPEDPPKG